MNINLSRPSAGGPECENSHRGWQHTGPHTLNWKSCSVWGRGPCVSFRSRISAKSLMRFGPLRWFGPGVAEESLFKRPLSWDPVVRPGISCREGRISSVLHLCWARAVDCPQSAPRVSCLDAGLMGRGRVRVWWEPLVYLWERSPRTVKSLRKHVTLQGPRSRRGRGTERPWRVGEDNYRAIYQWGGPRPLGTLKFHLKHRDRKEKTAALFVSNRMNNKKKKS